jgi:hypothetical protein
MKTKIILSILILSSFSIYLISCDNNMVNFSDVSGKIYNSNYSPAANVKVTIGDAVTHTSSDGSFRINNVGYPYNITILDSGHRKVSVFKKLSTDKVYLSFDNSYSGQEYADINVSVPDSIINSTNKKGKLIFTDGANIQDHSNINFPETSMRVFLNDNNPVTGKIILLTYKVNSSGNITSYENFGYIDNVTISPGGSYDYSFDSASVSLNPGEENVSGTVFFSQISTEISSSFSISFSGNDYLNERMSNEFPGASGTLFNFLVPTNLPLYFNTFIYKSYYSTQGRSFALYKVLPGIQNTIEPKPAVDIISPVSNASNVSLTTPFSFNDETGNGVYEIIIVDQSRYANYRIVTTSTNFTLQDIEQSGLGSIVNHDLFWVVIKNGVYSSVNDYTNNIKINTNWYNTVTESRFFSTVP